MLSNGKTAIEGLSGRARGEADGLTPSSETLSVQKVTPPGDGLDQALLVVAKRAAQLPDALHERIVGYDDIVPDGFLKVFLRDKAASALGQMAQYLEGLGPQLEFTVIQTQATARQIHRKAIELKYSRDDFAHFSTPGRADTKK